MRSDRRSIKANKLGADGMFCISRANEVLPLNVAIIWRHRFVPPFATDVTIACLSVCLF